MKHEGRQRPCSPRGCRLPFLHVCRGYQVLYFTCVKLLLSFHSKATNPASTKLSATLGTAQAFSRGVWISFIYEKWLVNRQSQFIEKCSKWLSWKRISDNYILDVHVQFCKSERAHPLLEVHTLFQVKISRNVLIPLKRGETIASVRTFGSAIMYPTCTHIWVPELFFELLNSIQFQIFAFGATAEENGIQI